MESNPRKVFYGMFGQGDTNAERVARLKATDSLLDYVMESTAEPEPQARCGGPRAGQRLPGFGARGRAPRAEARWPTPSRWATCRMRRVGTPDDFTELLDVQFEMIALALQTGQTRVASMG